MDKMVLIPDKNSSFEAFYAKPEGIVHPAIILIHEVWGLNDHIKDVARRFRNEGYAVLAPDLLSQTGITEKIDQSILAEIKNPDTRAEAQKKMRAAMAPIQSPDFGRQTVERLKVCLDFLEEDRDVTERLGVVGFCFGGTYAFALAAHDKRLSACVPFYGHAPENLNAVKNISCPVLAFYGKQDKNLVDDLPRLQDVMDKYGKIFESVMYEDTGHAFFNDTNPVTYNKKAANDSWVKTLSFLEENLGYE